MAALLVIPLILFVWAAAIFGIIALGAEVGVWPWPQDWRWLQRHRVNRNAP